MKWNAYGAVTRAPLHYEHLGLGWREAARRVVALSIAAREIGATKHIPAHIDQLAMCLVGMPDEEAG